MELSQYLTEFLSMVKPGWDICALGYNHDNLWIISRRGMVQYYL